VNAATLRLGSRRSPMAIAQSRHVADLITKRTGRRVEIVGVTTLGDASRAQLTQIGGTGVFVSALREALLRGEVDLVVHSLKDLPTAPAAGIVLAAVPARDDPRDALVARDGAKLADLPAGARIGTGSPRRAAQLLGLRGDLRCVPIRGNAGTRLAKVTGGELDGAVLAYAGLARIASVQAITQVFEPDEMPPAPGQGALAVECRDGEPELAALLGAVTDQASMAAVTAERSLLEALAAGCSAPVGAYAAGTELLRMRAAVISADGTRVLRAHGSAPGADARRLGRDLAAELLRRGAAELISGQQPPDEQQELCVVSTSQGPVTEVRPRKIRRSSRSRDGWPWRAPAPGPLLLVFMTGTGIVLETADSTIPA
jgi:hydroxymethylbilane synthase